MRTYSKVVLIIVKVAALLINCSVIASPVTEIDNYLVEKVADDNPTANLAAAREWSSEVQTLSKGTAETLQKFILLSKLQKADKCDRNSHAILLSNDKATGGFAHAIEPPQSRMARVVYMIAKEHGENCRDTYFKTYHSVFGGMDEQKILDVKTYMDDVIWLAKSISPLIRNEFALVEMSDDRLWENFLSRSKMQAFSAIDFLAKQDPNLQSLGYIEESDIGLRQAKPSHIAEMFRRYLIEPCEYFVKELGPDVFEPALYDNILRQSSPIDKLRSDFYLSWAHFRLCQALLKSDNKSLLMDVEKVFGEVRI